MVDWGLICTRTRFLEIQLLSHSPNRALEFTKSELLSIQHTSKYFPTNTKAYFRTFSLSLACARAYTHAMNCDSCTKSLLGGFFPTIHGRICPACYKVLFVLPAMEQFKRDREKQAIVENARLESELVLALV